ncbi:9329_t:CDS:10 [Gigaspora margarita]|uniref:9329_t:CDS:1 n=1 Tax=Gigaspora margarita TaxID=4874 RepID=A0ABM8VW92_GIGMA|nr:9329_t:CDS:10 [Gigaspora margarita]
MNQKGKYKLFNVINEQIITAAFPPFFNISKPAWHAKVPNTTDLRNGKRTNGSESAIFKDPKRSTANSLPSKLPSKQDNTDQPPQEPQVPKERPAKLSRFTTTNIALPSHADSRGLVPGGVVLSWIDLAAGTSAKRHAVYPCVTRSVDAVHFMHPIRVGDLIIIVSSVNKSWNTSMEVGVRVETEHPITGKRKYCCQAYLTFVALSTGNSRIPVATRSPSSPVTVPRIIPNTAIETHRKELAEKRRQSRISHSKEAQIERDKLTKIREVMREWAGYMNMETMSNAEIPPLLQEPEAYEERDGNSDNDPAKLFLHRRRSTLQGVFPAQPDERLVSESFAEIADIILPQHANTLQITFGGHIIELMEQCALVSAYKHSRRYLLLASIDSLQFIRPTYVGDCVTVRSIVSCTFHSSLEIYVSVEAENLLTGERFFTNDGFFTMDQSQVVELFESAKARRNRRLLQRKEIIQKELSTHPEEFEQFVSKQESP